MPVPRACELAPAKLNEEVAAKVDPSSTKLPQSVQQPVPFATVTYLPLAVSQALLQGGELEQSTVPLWPVLDADVPAL